MSTVPTNPKTVKTKEEENLSEFIHNEVAEILDDEETSPVFNTTNTNQG